jgi:hypothetical protein
MTSKFDPHLRLLAGHVAYAKGSVDEFVVEFWFDRLHECLRYAPAILPSSIPNMILLLDEMGKLGSIVCRTGAASQESIQDSNNARTGLWAFYMGQFKHLDQEKFPGGFDQAFLSLAVVFGIVEYVRVKAGLGCLIQKPTVASPTDNTPRYVTWPLLMDSVLFNNSRALERVDFQIGSFRRLILDYNLNLPMMQCLLDKGADPNYMVGKPHGAVETSPLIESLSQLMLTASRSEDYAYWVEVIRIFARVTRIDNDVVDCAIRIFLSEEDLNWPKFSLKTFMQWNSATKCVRKALQELTRGKRPNFFEVVAHVRGCALTSVFKSPAWPRPSNSTG